MKLKRFTRQAHGYIYNRKLRRRYQGTILGLAVLVTLVVIYLYLHTSQPAILNNLGLTPPTPQPGDLLGEDTVQTFTPAQTIALARQNYGGATPPITTGITKITFRYRSRTPDGQDIIEYARAYLPDAPKSNLPIFAFAPGTTGIGDQCAPSLEQPAKANWANYDSHMAAYASQGFAAVTTDYEGMRDTSRIHHYMVGQLEGRAVLDSIRALKALTEAKGRLNTGAVFLSGYSQGGHAAFWADKIAASYAPDIKPKGVVTWGPVMSVKETFTDVTRGANINWFGPYVLYSYRDYYHASYGPVLLQHWENTLATDVPAHCIDTDIPFWGRNPAGVYTPEFLQAVGNGILAEQYPTFIRDLDANEVGVDPSSSAKRINEGDSDNVVLPIQQQTALPQLCSSSAGPVQLAVYPHTTHYDAMVHSFADTLGWMRTLINGGQVPSICPAATPVPTPTPGTPTPTPVTPTESPAP